MSDQRMRGLERRYQASGDPADRSAWESEHIRAGLGKLPRLVIRHYIDEEHHGRCNSSGAIDIKVDRKSGGWPYHTNKIRAKCSVELWPRDLVYDRYPPKMKKVFYTEDPHDVTCKRCLASINKPGVRVRRRVHYAPSQRAAIERGERVVPVCGRDDSDRFEESFIWDLSSGPLTCPACRRTMQRGRRAARHPRLAVLGPLDGLDGGRFPVGSI